MKEKKKKNLYLNLNKNNYNNSNKNELKILLNVRGYCLNSRAKPRGITLHIIQLRNSLFSFD